MLEFFFFISIFSLTYFPVDLLRAAQKTLWFGCCPMSIAFVAQRRYFACKTPQRVISWRCHYLAAFFSCCFSAGQVLRHASNSHLIVFGLTNYWHFKLLLQLLSCFSGRYTFLDGAAKKRKSHFTKATPYFLPAKFFGFFVIFHI